MFAWRKNSSKTAAFLAGVLGPILDARSGTCFIFVRGMGSISSGSPSFSLKDAKAGGPYVMRSARNFHALNRSCIDRSLSSRSLYIGGRLVINLTTVYGRDGLRVLLRRKSAKSRASLVVCGCKGNIDAVVRWTRVSAVKVSMVGVACGKSISKLS